MRKAVNTLTHRGNHINLRNVLVWLMMLGFILLLSFSSTEAQPRFKVPLYVTDGFETDTVYFGILPGGNFCIVESDSIDGTQEFFIPPEPPTGVFDARFKWPRSGVNLVCFDQGAWADFRPYVSATQRDTFRFRSQLGDGTTMVLSWPSGLSNRFTSLTLRYFDQDSGRNIDVNMRQVTSANITGAGDPAFAWIYSDGLVVSVEPGPPGVPHQFALSQNYPNPFNPSTTFEFALPHAAEIEIAVYDILGQKVAMLASGMYTSGYYTATWDGRNGAGGDVSTGVYFVRMTAIPAAGGANFSATRKVLLMR